MSGILFIGFVVLLFLMLSLRGRVRRLESRLGIGAETVATPVGVVAPPAAPTVAASATGQGVASSAHSMYGPQQGTPDDPGIAALFIKWLVKDWLVKLGALLLLIGFGWFVSYAFLQGWIGEVGRITMGLVAGALILALGEWRIRNYVHQGGIFLVLGSTVILLTVFAARELYGFFSPATALLIMFLSAAFVAFSSVLHNSRALAGAGLILAALAPLLTAAGIEFYFVSLYLLMVVLGTLAVAAIRGWQFLTGLSLIAVFVYHLPHMSNAYGLSVSTWNYVGMAFLFTLIFFIASIAAALRTRPESGFLPYQFVASGTGLYLILWILGRVPDHLQSLVCALWALLFAVATFLVFTLTKRRELFTAYLAVAVALLGAATAVELRGATLTIAFAIEAVLIVAALRIVIGDPLLARRASSLLIIPAALSIPSIFSPLTGHVINRHFFVIVVMALAATALGMILSGRDRKESVDNRTNFEFSGAFYTFAGIYGLILIWQVLHNAMESYEFATMFSLAIYTLIGLGLYFKGKFSFRKDTTTMGGVLIALVVGRLLFHDVWAMHLTGRIVTFFVIGALLMLAAFIKPRRLGGVVPSNERASQPQPGESPPPTPQ